MFLGGGRNDTVDLMHFIVPDHIADGGGQAHDLKYGNIVSIYIRHKLLRDDSLQDHGKLNGHLSLLAGLKHVHNTSDGIGSTDGVQAGKHQMPGFRGSHGSLDGLVIAHFPQKDNIRALAQSVARRETR